MFWRKSEPLSPTTVSQPAKPVPKSGSTDEFDRVLDTLGAFLREYGESAFDTDQTSAAEVSENCSELWRELSLGTTRNSDSARDEPRRDYAKVLRFFSTHRRYERDFVVRGLGNLRHAVQEFAQCLTAAVHEDRQADTNIDAQVTRLVTVSRGNDVDAIREEAAKVATLVRSAIDRRRDREKEQLLHLGMQVQALRSELDAARTRATLDGLTQLFNRAAFDEELAKVAALGLLLGAEPCLVMVDVDHFKAINDRHGHPIGDEVLRRIADNLVRHFLRKEDFVCRYGGEEFAIVVRESTLEKVAQRVERARLTLTGTAVTTSIGDIDVSFSAGVAPLIPGEPPAQWIERADQALYRAKHQGRNRVLVADTRGPTT